MGLSESCIGNSAVNPLSTALYKFAANVGNLYCRLFHRSIFLPVNGRYRCWKCLREFELEW